MSVYCAQADILGEIQMADLIRCTDDAPETGALNTVILNQVIANASGEIDRYVGNMYTVPFNPVPPSVESMATIIACYRLLRRREVPDEKNKFYEEYGEIRDFLKEVKAGQAFLDLSVQTAFAPVQTDQRGTIFGWGNFLSNSM